MFLDPRILEDIRSIDPLAIVDALLILATVGIARRQSLKLDELRTKQRAHEIESGNKLATLEQITGFDALTGLRGQRWFENALATALRGYRPVSIIYIDLDGIKALNSAKGHQFVDGVIRNAAMVIRTSLRRTADRDMICRRGTAADEFLVILNGAALKTAVARAEQILTSLRSMGVTASIGVAVRHADRRMSAADLERAAELEMDRAKESGRNCVLPVIPAEAETVQQRSRRNLRATRYRLKQRSRAVAMVPAGAADAIPEEIAADATERIEVTEQHVAA
jgi:diguanylate cyclase (GGDEF)-like protein